MPRYLFDPSENGGVFEADTDEAFNQALDENPSWRPATDGEVYAALQQPTDAAPDEDQSTLQQADDAKKTVIERVAESIPEPATAFFESYGRAYAPILYQEFEEAVGVAREQQLRRAEESPIASALGMPAGIVGSIVTPMKFGAIASPTTMAAQGIREGVSALANKALPAAVASSAGKSASATGRIALDVLASFAEGAYLGAAYSADEQLLKEQPLNVDAILHAAVNAGEFGAVLGGTVRAYKEFGKTAWGSKADAKLAEKVAENALRQLNVSVREIRIFKKQTSRAYETRLLNDAVDYGLVGPGISPKTSLALAEDMVEKSGETIGAFADEAAARVAAAGGKEAAVAPRLDDVLETISDRVVMPLLENPEAQKVAQAVVSRLNTYKQIFDRPGRQFSAKDIHFMRKEIDKTIYGLRGLKDPTRSREISVLREVRGILNEEMMSAIAKTGILPDAVKFANRQYAVAARIESMAEAGLERQVNALAQMTTRQKIMKLAKGALAFGPEAIIKSPAYLAVGNDWVYHGLRKAIKDKMPEPVIQKMHDFASRQRMGLLQDTANLGVLLPAERDLYAQVEQARIMTTLSDAITEMSSNPKLYPRRFRLRVFEMKKDLGDVLARQSTPDQIADQLESIERELNSFARFSNQTKPFLDWERSIDVARFIRDDIRVSLAQANLWGPARQKAAVDRLTQAADMMIDPNRQASLESLREMTSGLMSDIQRRSDRLMNTAIAPSARRIIQTQAALAPAGNEEPRAIDDQEDIPPRRYRPFDVLPEPEEPSGE